jgi:nucleoside-diphosphate-sugar epimerase
MSQISYSLSPGSWVLVSGANGFIASHIVDILLERGYNVRGTVRAEKPWLNRFFETKYGEGRFETVIVSAIEHDGAFNEAAKGVSGFIHVVCES